MQKSKFTKLLCLVLSLVMILGAAPITVFAADDSVTYIERSWDAAGKKVVEETKTASATAITGSETTLNGGWYVVKGSVSADNRITVNGDNENPTCIILADGCKFTVTGGIGVTSGKTLNIYGQANGTGELTATGGGYVAAIGGNDYSSGDSSIGIGNCGAVTIHGGTVIATGGYYGAGIGGGSCASGGDVTIYDGTVIATGGSCGAGIGGGYGVKFSGGNGGTLTVCGGTVEAVGGDGAAGIGAGYVGRGGTFTMNGGTVTAVGGISAAGIGPGEKAYSNGTVILGTIVEGYATDTLGEEYNITTAEDEKPYASFEGADKEINDIAFSKIELHTVAHTHSIAAEWSHNAIGHWHGCTTLFCNITSYATCELDGVDYSVHTYSDGICTVCGYAEGSGDGTAEYPYVIATKADLEKLAEDVNGGKDFTGIYFVLAEDIGTKADPFSTPIGFCPPNGYGGNSFNGIFEGNDHTVFVDMKGSSSGLFGNVGSSGVVKNVTVAGTVTGDYDGYFGGVCGMNYGSIVNCTNTCAIFGDYSGIYFGGVCGCNRGSIINCANSGSVGPLDEGLDIYIFGGVCGFLETGSLINCTNSGTISSGPYSMDFGGVCGLCVEGQIINCTNSGKISSAYGSAEFGGVCGNLDYDCSLINCTSSGAIVLGEDTYSFGGVLGKNYYDNSIIANCYYDSTLTGDMEGVGDDAGSSDVPGLPTEQMTAVSGTENALVDLLNNYIDTENLEDCYHWAKTTDGYPYIAETTYKVTVNASENGNIFVPSGYMDPDAAVAVTVVPDVDYVLKNLKYNDGTDKDITEAKSFTMPEANVTVTAEFGELVMHTHSFAEIWTTDETAHWHECTAEDCDIEDYADCVLEGAAYGEHTYANGKCTVCGALDPDFTVDENGVLTKYNGAGGDVVLPDTVKAIADNAFNSNKKITSVTGAKVTSIGYQSFVHASNLVSVSFPELTAVGQYAFQDCKKLTTVTAPKLTTVDYMGFSECKALTSITSSAVTTLGDYAFYQCEALVSFDASNVTTVGNSAFGYTSALKSIEMPKVTTMGYTVFTGSGVKSILLTDSVKTVQNNSLPDRMTVNYPCDTDIDALKAGLKNAYKPNFVQLPHSFEDGVCTLCGADEAEVLLAEAKTTASAAVNALAGVDDSDEVKAIVAQAIEDIEAAETAAAVEAIAAAAEADVAAQKAAEEAAAALAEAKAEAEEWFSAPLNTLVLGYYSPELVAELIEGLDDLTSPDEIAQYKADSISAILEAREEAFEDNEYLAMVNEIEALADALGFEDEKIEKILADFDEFLAEDYEGKTVEEVLGALEEEFYDAADEEAMAAVSAKLCFSLILTFNSDWASAATETEADMNDSLIWSTIMFNDNDKFIELIEEDVSFLLGRLVPECYPDYIQSYSHAAFGGASDVFDTAFAALMGDVKEAKADAELAEAKEDAAADVEALASDDDSDEVAAIIEKALADIEDAEDIEAVEAIIEKAETDVAAQKALEADKAAFEEYKLAQAENCAKLEQDGDSQSVKDVIAATATVISMASYDEDKTLAQNKAEIDELVGDLENNLPVMRAYEAAVAEITEAAGEAPSEAVQAILDQAFSDLANADNVEAINAVKELALEDVAEQQAAEAAEALAALKGATITIINTMKDNAVSDEAKALADEAIEAVENAESIEELDAAFSGLEEAMEAKDAEFAETKDDAKTAIEALAGDDASDEVKAIVEKALADIEKATSKEALAQIAADAEKDVDEQQAAEAAAALAAAKEAAKAAIDAAIADETDEAVIAAAEEAKAAIDAANTIEAVEAAKAAGLEKMSDASGACPYCGQKEHKNWIDKLFCFIKRVVKLLFMVFDFADSIKAE